MKFEEFEFINYDPDMIEIFFYNFKTCTVKSKPNSNYDDKCFHKDKKSAIYSLFYVLVLK